MSALVVAPVVVPLGAALLGVALHRRDRMQRAVTWVGIGAFVACALLLVGRVVVDGRLRLELGSWPAPSGIEFVVDGIGASMVLLTSVLGLVTFAFQQSAADPAPRAASSYPLILLLLAGTSGVFTTGDLFNLYVWFEVLLLASLATLIQRGTPLHLEATLKYFVPTTLGTLLLLIGIAAVYAATGHLNFTALAHAARAPSAEAWSSLTALLACAFLIKAGSFPVFGWLPASYPTLPAPLLALFAGLLTKAGVYALLRVVGDVFATAPRPLYEAIGWLGCLTMLVGALGAAYHWDMRRILAFHVISQIGYMLVGIAFATPKGATAAVFFLIHNVLAKTNLILIAAVVFRLTGSYDLRRCGGLYVARPGLAVLFLVSALAMVGVPPLSGFWAKVLIVREAFATEHGVWAVVALMTGLLTLYSMLKIWMEAFWKAHPKTDWTPPRTRGLAPAYACVAGVAGLIVGLGLVPEPVVSFLESASTHLGSGRLTALDVGTGRSWASDGEGATP